MIRLNSRKTKVCNKCGVKESDISGLNRSFAAKNFKIQKNIQATQRITIYQPKSNFKSSKVVSLF